MIRLYNNVPDHYDPRDKPFLRSIATPRIPDVTDMRSLCPPVYDQGQIGLCTMAAGGGAIEFTEMEQAAESEVIRPSLFFGYKMSRILQGTEDFDSGSSNRTCLKAAATFGYCRRELWNDPKKWNDKPSKAAAADAAKRKLKKELDYQFVNKNWDEICAAIAERNPVIFATTVYEDFEKRENIRRGILDFPASDNARVLGGHAMLLVGYNRNKGVAIYRNSWGRVYGMQGYGTVSKAFLLSKNVRDLWIVKHVPNT
jgi:C1A family cysteine protease